MATKKKTEDLDILGQIDMSSGSNKALQDAMFDKMRSIKEMTDMLKDMMSEDVKRYFNAATPMEQLLIKGAYFRIKWILGQLQKRGDPKKVAEKRPKGIKIGRYAE